MIPTLIARSRSAWKGPYFVSFPNLHEARANNIPIETKARACTILPSFVGLRFHVHNGKTMIPVHVTADMIGHKLGEFSPTRKRGTHPPDSKEISHAAQKKAAAQKAAKKSGK